MASGRLARGNASVAIGVDMHLTALLNVVRPRQVGARWARAAVYTPAGRVSDHGG
jgi:hypothetical protein